MVLAPMGQALIDAYGWRFAMVAFAAVAASLAVLSLGITERHRAADAQAPAAPQPLGAALREAARHRGFVAMTVAYFACGFQLVFITTHLPQYLELCGVSPSVSATALALIGLFNTVGTYAFGLLGARYSQKRLLALIYLLRTVFIGVFVALPVTPESTLVFAAAMGLLWLGVAPLVTGLIGRVFGLTHFNTLYGVVFLGHQVGSFAGAWMGGVVFDFTGAYGIAWAALIAIGAIAFTLQWTMDDRPPPVRRTAGAVAPAGA
jgi:predicted MFS family arabinose efflux permease